MSRAKQAFFALAALALLALAAPALRHSLGHALEVANLRVLLAGGGEEGLAVLAQQRVDAIVADAGLIDRAGQVFLQRARQRQPEASFLFLAASDLMAEAAASLPQELACHLLPRDLGGEIVVTAVLEALRQKELLDENRRLTQEAQAASLELRRVEGELRSLAEAQKQHARQQHAASDVADELLQHLPLAIIGVDATGMIAYANQVAEQLLPDDGLIGADAVDRLPPPLQALLAQGAGHGCRLEVAGRCFWAECSLFGPAHALRGLLLTLGPTQQFDPEQEG